MDTQGQANVEPEPPIDLPRHPMPVDSHPEMCGECGNESILADKESGEYVCGECGLVVGEIVSLDPEWRAFDLEQREKRTRTGIPSSELIHDKGMSTMIDSTNRDYTGRKLTPEQRDKNWRLIKWNRRSKVDNAKGRNLSHSLNIIHSYCNKLHIPKNAAEKSATLYRAVLNGGYVRGRSVREMTAACVYAIIREDRALKRPLKEFCKTLGMNKSERKAVARSYRFIHKMGKEDENLRRLMPKVDKASDTVAGIVNNMSLIPYIEQMSVGIARYVERPENRRNYTAGKDTQSMSAGILYVTTVLTRSDNMPEEKRVVLTQKMIADAASVTEVTLRNRMRGLEEQLSKDFGIDEVNWKEIANVLGIIVDDYIAKNKRGNGIPYNRLKREFSEYELDGYLHFLEETSIVESVGTQHAKFYKPNFAIA